MPGAFALAKTAVGTILSSLFSCQNGEVSLQVSTHGSRFSEKIELPLFIGLHVFHCFFQ
jgi:hypothetical protein